MAWYTYESAIALDAQSGGIARSAAGQVYAVSDVLFSAPLSVTDLAGVSRTELVANAMGVLEPFRVQDNPTVVWKSGPYVIVLPSFQGMLDEATAARALADAAATSAAAAATSAAASAAAAEAAAASASTTAAGISDATDVGRAVLTAATQAAARTAIGAGTSSLVLGTTAGTAKAGDYSPPAATQAAAGVVELATVTEAETGTDTTRAVTPAGLAAAVSLGLSGLSGTVYVTTENGVLPDLPDNTLIARYAALVPGTPVITAAGQTIHTTTATAITVTTTAAIPAGDVLAVALSRGLATGATGGTAVVTTSAGAIGTQARASAQRASVAEADLILAPVTATIPSGSTITVTTSGNTINRGVVVVAGISALSSAVPDATSGDDAAGVTATSSAGSNASSTSLTVAHDAPTTVTNTLVLGVWAYNASVNWSPAAGVTSVADVQTAVGTADRGILVAYKVVAPIASQSIQATAPASGAIAGASVALPIALVPA